MDSITPGKNNRKEILGWNAYDWADHAFFNHFLGFLIGEYLTTLAQKVVGENGAILTIAGYDLVTAKSFFS